MVIRIPGLEPQLLSPPPHPPPLPAPRADTRPALSEQVLTDFWEDIEQRMRL
ncbi:hypothetical protein [Streptomyces sp.]|uniref:hypothetical protein n=1 Tax=Streptomyces sp. TaxID=1931 RepID=UPI002F3ED629